MPVRVEKRGPVTTVILSLDILPAGSTAPRPTFSEVGAFFTMASRGDEDFKQRLSHHTIVKANGHTL